MTDQQKSGLFSWLKSNGVLVVLLGFMIWTLQDWRGDQKQTNKQMIEIATDLTRAIDQLEFWKGVVMSGKQKDQTQDGRIGVNEDDIIKLKIKTNTRGGANE